MNLVLSSSGVRLDVKSSTPHVEPSNGCPVVSESNALALIHDIGSMEMAKRIPAGTLEPTFENVEEWWSSRFPHVPRRI